MVFRFILIQSNVKHLREGMNWVLVIFFLRFEQILT